MQAVYQAPHLLLHFDINGTLTLKDSTKTTKDNKQISNEYMLLSALAESTVAVWDPHYPKMPFKDYVYNVLFPGDKNDPAIKAERQATISQFIPWLKEHHHPAFFKVQHEYQELIRRFTDIHTNRLELEIFDSFYTLINKLQEMKIPFTIILRTFGKDLEDTVKEMENNPRQIPIKFGSRIDMKDLTLTDNKAQALFLNFIYGLKHVAIQDDWTKWSRDQERGRSGKPFMFDPNATVSDTLSLFFDDKITGDEKDIINPINLAGTPASTKELKGRYIFPVNTTKAALDEQYYVKKVLKALANH